MDSEQKEDDIDYSVYCKRAIVFWIYISSNIRVRTLYLLDFSYIQLGRCRLLICSVWSMLRHLMKIAILVQV